MSNYNNKVLQELETIKAALRAKSPFLASLVAAATFKLTNEVAVAASDAKKTIYINEEAFIKLNYKERLFAVLHETLHLALQHHKRAAMLGVEDAQVYNIAGDCLINGLLINERVIDVSSLTEGNLSGIVQPMYIASLLGRRVEEIMAMSTEELYRLLMQKKQEMEEEAKKQKEQKEQGKKQNNAEEKELPKGCGLHAHTPDGSSSEGQGQMQDEKGSNGSSMTSLPSTTPSPSSSSSSSPSSSEGKKEGEGVGEGGDDEDAGEYWAKKVEEAYVQSKMAGHVPLGVERMFRLGKSRVRWNVLLRSAVKSGLGSKVVSSYTKPNRRVPLLPGLKWLKVPDVFFGIDTSGSITEKELSIAASEIYAVAKLFNADITVVFWDAEVQNVQKFTSASQIAQKLQPKGGGGTVVFPALQYIAKHMKVGDVIVLISDGYIADSDDNSVIDIAADLASKSSAAIFVSTTSSLPKWKGWRIIQIDEIEK